ncbi:MAG: hypothetical protein V1929_11400 [bacterium]
MATALLPKDFKEFLKLLGSKRVKYLLIGGYAVGYHGFPRATADMDIWIALNPQNATKAMEALKTFGFGQEELTAELFQKKDQIIRMGRPPFRIEVLTGISGVEFEACYKRRVVDTIDGVKINIINLQDLKRNKKASGRHKDLEDLQHLP